ncbi:MAG: PG0541 family transporter-associated protein [Candidatus Cryptobacteroides sp.]
MKAIFIAYNQAYGSEIIELLDAFGQRGFTQWLDIQGRGGIDGEPHYGDHAWPTQNFAILTIVPDDKAEPMMAALKEKDEAYPNLGLRAFAWDIEQSV